MGIRKPGTIGIVVVSGLLYLGMPALLLMISPATSSTAMDTMAQRQARNSSAFAVMLGEFRTSVGDMLFVKTERYLDSGIAYEPHIDVGELAKTGDTDGAGDGERVLGASLSSARVQEGLAISPGTVESHDHDDHGHEDHDHGHAHDDHGHEQHEAHDHAEHDHGHDGSIVETLIRTADRDFRGFIGDLERKVKPWRDPKEPHIHTAGTELLPWYRLATLSDPHNVRNYMIGAWWLKTLQTPEQQQEALQFLDEGIAANPEAYELYLMKGYVLKDLEMLSDAKKYFATGADLAIKNRPPGGPESTPEWDLTDDEQMAAAMSMHIILTRDTVSTASALQLTDEYLRRVPTEGSLHRIKANLESGK